MRSEGHSRDAVVFHKDARCRRGRDAPRELVDDLQVSPSSVLRLPFDGKHHAAHVLPSHRKIQAHEQSVVDAGPKLRPQLANGKARRRVVSCVTLYRDPADDVGQTSAPPVLRSENSRARSIVEFDNAAVREISTGDEFGHRRQRRPQV